MNTEATLVLPHSTSRHHADPDGVHTLCGVEGARSSTDPKDLARPVCQRCETWLPILAAVVLLDRADR